MNMSLMFVFRGNFLFKTGLLKAKKTEQMELICSHTSLVNKGFITELKGKNVYQEQSRKESLAAMLLSLHGTAAT